MLTYSSVVRASVEGLAGRLIGRSFFFGAAAFLFGLDRLCLWTEAIFSFNFWEAACFIR